MVQGKDSKRKSANYQHMRALIFETVTIAMAIGTVVAIIFIFLER